MKVLNPLQIAVFILGQLAIIAICWCSWELAIPATVNSRWFAFTYFGFMVGPIAAMGCLVYGVLKWAKRNQPPDGRN